LIIRNKDGLNYDVLGIRKVIIHHKYKILFSVFLTLLIIPIIITVNYRSRIGAELSYSYWPKQQLENKNVAVLLKYIGKSLSNKVSTILSSPDIPTVHIDVKFKHYRKISEWRQNAIDTGFPLDKDRQYVPATMRHGSAEAKIKIRLKGDLLDHYDTERWSFRVKVRDSDAILGMRVFSVQEPERRGFTAEPIFFEHLRQYDILVPRYFFINLIFNGQPWGVMAVEEVPSKELLEYAGRRESIIFHYNDTPGWESIASGNEQLTEYYQNHYSADFAAYGRKKIIKSSKLHRLYLRGRFLLEGWRDGRLKTSDVFDVKRWATVMALSEIWHSKHQLKFSNLRFYFNPIVEKFEPVVYDLGRVFYNDVNRASDRLLMRDVPFVNHLLQDPVMKLAFENALRTVAKDIISGRVIRKIRPAAVTITKQLIHEKFYIADFPLDMLTARSKALLSREHFDQEKIRPQRFSHIESESFESIAYGTFFRSEQGITVELSNKLPLEVQLCGLDLHDPINKFRKTLYLPTVQNLIKIPAAPIPLSYPTKQVLNFDLPIEEKLALSRATKITACLETENSRQPVFESLLEIAPPKHRSIAIVDDTVTATSLSDRFPFIRKTSKNTVTMIPGVWGLKETIIIPKNLSLIVSAGVELKIAPGVVIVVHGATKLRGTAAKPIILQSANENSSWNGIVVFHGSSDQSKWNHVVIKNTDRPNLFGWTTTGAVTFHRGIVELENVSIFNTQAEDALNIVAANVSLMNVHISNTRSDAFDCDFCRGFLSQLQIDNSGGDGYDISGSRTRIENSSFANIQDKAISAGEGSHLVGKNISIDGAGFAVVSKDSSSVMLDGVRLAKIQHTGFMTYKKKAEYSGTEEIDASNVITVGDFKLHRAAHGSRITVNGGKASNENIDVRKLYASGPMKKN
jgi:hypothetical protein